MKCASQTLPPRWPVSISVVVCVVQTVCSCYNVGPEGKTSFSHTRFSYKIILLGPTLDCGSDVSTKCKFDHAIYIHGH